MSQQNIDRRAFMRGSLAAGVGLATASRGCAPPPETSSDAPRAASSLSDFELDEATIGSLQEWMESGRHTARSIVELYLQRIEAVDRSGPELRSIIETNGEALAIADELDRQRRESGPRSPVHGIPVLVKDNVGTADSMTTTAGSLALEGSIPTQDATIARKLREAGAIVLAKTNLSEWANFRSTRSSSGWSGRGGQCKNPYVLDRNPCGSSSGSGAATSANLGAVAIGTETDGSIVCPSNANGLVGIKPTLGLLSRAGIIPIAHSQDTAGPMSRTVTDGAILLGVLAGVDPRDPATSGAEGNAHPDYTVFLDPDGLRDARIGVVRDLFGFHPDVDERLEEALSEMKRRGAVLVDPVALRPSAEYDATEMTVLLYEFKADLNRYLAELGDAAPMSTLAEIIEFNERHRDREMPYFGQEIFEMAQAKGALDEPEYRDALATNRRLSREEGIDKTLAEHGLDALVAPTGGPAWTTDLVNGDHFSGGSSAPAAVAGYPNVTVPAGSVRGLPIGLSFFGGAWSEPTLLRLAYAFERATSARTKPTFAPTLPS